jgi:hypothetical protein
MRAALVLAHQPAVANQIDRDDRGQAALLRHVVKTTPIW